MCLGPRSNPTLFVAAEKVLSLGILEGTAGNDIDPYEHHHCHNKNHIDFPPFFSQVPQKTSLAGVTIIAQ